jgi:hypothetical protein
MKGPVMTKLSKPPVLGVLGLFLAASLLAACDEEKGTAEKAGEKIDKAVEQTADQMEKAADKLEEKADEMQEKAN